MDPLLPEKGCKCIIGKKRPAIKRITVKCPNQNFVAPDPGNKQDPRNSKEGCYMLSIPREAVITPPLKPVKQCGCWMKSKSFGLGKVITAASGAISSCQCTVMTTITGQTGTFEGENKLLAAIIKSGKAFPRDIVYTVKCPYTSFDPSNKSDPRNSDKGCYTTKTIYRRF